MIRDTITMIKRNLIRYIRVPQLIVFSSIQPIMFLLLFTYVFGGAIKSSSADYIKFLLPGILVQTVLFGSMQTGMGLAEDLQKGIIDRFKSLPMAQSSILAGRIISDAIRNIFVITLMLGVGYLIGFRFENSYIEIVDAIGLVILFGFAFSWVSACIGIALGDIETAQVAGFIWVFPLVFASSIFVPTETMPKYLKAFAERNPISIMSNSVRELMLGNISNELLIKAFLWIFAIVIIFAPLAAYLYRKKS